MNTNQRVLNLTASDLARILVRHTRKFLLVVFLAVVATVGWILLPPREYESIAKVYVKVGHENNTLDPSATTGQTVNIQQTLESEVNSMLQVIESQETAELVVASVGVEPILENDLLDDASAASSKSAPSLTGSIKSWLSSIKETVLPNPFEESRESRAVRELLKRSTFWAPRNSNVIEISCKAGHPGLAQKITAAWTDSFIKNHLKVSRTEGSNNFFIQQTSEIESRLAKTEDELGALRSASGLVSIEGHRKVLEDQAINIRTRSLANQSALEVSLAKSKKLEELVKSIPQRLEAGQTTSESHQGWNLLREKLFDLQVREQELKAKYSDISPQVIAVERQRIAVEEILATQPKSASETTDIPNPMHQFFEQALLTEQAQIASFTAEEHSLELQSQQNSDEFRKLNENAIALAKLEREVLNLETSYRESFARMEQAKTLEALEQANISSISVLQHASFNTRPTGLGAFRKLLIGTFLGIVAGLCFAGVAEYFNRSFVTRSQVEQALELPVLTSIPNTRSQFTRAG